MDTDDDAVVGHDQTVFVAVDCFQGNKITILLIDIDGLDTLGTSGCQSVVFDRCLLAVTELGYDQDL